MIKFTDKCQKLSLPKVKNLVTFVYNLFTMSVYRNIRLLREMRNFTQQHMADEMGLSIGGYGKIERGVSDIKLSQLIKIAKILNTDLNILINFDPNTIFNELS